MQKEQSKENLTWRAKIFQVLTRAGFRGPLELYVSEIRYFQLYPQALNFVAKFIH